MRAPSRGPHAPPEPKSYAPAGRAQAARAAVLDIYELLKSLSDRASGTYHERRAARLLAEEAERRFGPRGFGVSHQGFAVDLSSGAMNIALHGALLVLLSFIPLLLGAIRVWSGEAQAAGSGLLALFPRSSLLIAAIASIMLLLARLLPGAIGWSLFSFFIPNLESCNVIVDDLPEVERPLRRSVRHPDAPAGDGPFDVEALVWQRRFAAARAEGRKRLVILAAHYDSARALPKAGGLEKGSFFGSVVKTGFALITAGAYAAIAVCLSVLAALALWPAFEAAFGFWWRLALVIVFALGAVVALLELILASISSQLPYVQGYNDNLSGVAAAFAALEDLGSGGVTGPRPAYMLVLTGSEENGLHGSMAFARRVLDYATDAFSHDGVELWNFESVSGDFLQVSYRERTFSAFIREGCKDHALAYAQTLAALPDSVPNPPGGREDPHFTGLVAVEGAEALRVEVAERPMAACTDLTGFCAPHKQRGCLRILTFTALEYASGDEAARERSSGEAGMDKPRDYHRLEDDYQAALEPRNLATVVGAAILCADQIRRA